MPDGNAALRDYVLFAPDNELAVFAITLENSARQYWRQHTICYLTLFHYVETITGMYAIFSVIITGVRFVT